MSTSETIEQILDLGRWAPSGDNTQPWRFERVDDFNVVVHGFDTRDHCVYDLDGRASQVSLGALLETISIAASGYGRTMVARLRAGLPAATPTFDVQLASSSAVARDPLFDCIVRRTVQRRAMSTRRFTSSERVELEGSVAPRFRVQWLETFGERWAAASLMFRNAKVRLTMPEAYEVHRAIIEWGAQFSEDKVPDAALGARPSTTKLMRFAMKSWDRVSFFNRYLAGTHLPRFEMDFVPSLACAAHCVLVDSKSPHSIDDHVAAGRAVQRFWLTLTKLGLQQQPEMTPLLFEAYVRQGVALTKDPQVAELARQVAGRLRGTIGVDPAHAVWMGRVGAGAFARARSTRLPLSRLEWHAVDRRS